MPGIGYWPWAKPIGQRHSDIVVTVPASSRRDLGFKSHPRQIFFRSPSCVHGGLKRFVVADLLPLFYFVVVNECTEALGYWNL